MTQPQLPEIYRKPLNYGLLAIFVGLNGVCNRGVPLYSIVRSFGKNIPLLVQDEEHVYEKHSFVFLHTASDQRLDGGKAWE